ncbi:hypothetical protein AB1Y20_015735 [Prymnesium parvum]|uniref:Uncharacterized protein n=2 Tax=Prymnesium parvum TaxID=97485 RepID=A0AB34K3U5_PRYPA
MAATRPWWHEIVAGLSTERIPAAPGGGAPLRPPARQESPSEPRYGDHTALASRSSRLPGGVITRRNVEWDPGSPALEWVRRVTHDGRALAIRRAQDARRRQPLGITPRGVMRPAPRTSPAIQARQGRYLVPFVAPTMGRQHSLSSTPHRPSPPSLGGGGADLHSQLLVRPDNARVMRHETAQPLGGPTAAPTSQPRRTEPVPLLPPPLCPTNDTSPPSCPPTVDAPPEGHVTIQRPHVTPSTSSIRHSCHMNSAASGIKHMSRP